MSNRNRHKPKKKNSIDWEAFAVQTISGVIAGVAYRKWRDKHAKR